MTHDPCPYSHMAKTKDIKNPSIPVELGSVFNYLLEGVAIHEPEDTAPLNHEPVVDMYSTDESLIIEIELPGIRKDEIDIELMRNVVTIKGLKYECFNDRRINFVCVERSFGRFCRIIELIHPVDASKARAVYREGILKITLPKIHDRRGVPKKIVIE